MVMLYLNNKKNEKKEAACNEMIFISAICHGQWNFTSYILQKIIYIFHNHVSQSAELSLSFKNDVKISRHYLSVSNSAGAL